MCLLREARLLLLHLWRLHGKLAQSLILQRECRQRGSTTANGLPPECLHGRCKGNGVGAGQWEEPKDLGNVYTGPSNPKFLHLERYILETTVPPNTGYPGTGRHKPCHKLHLNTLESHLLGKKKGRKKEKKRKTHKLTQVTCDQQLSQPHPCYWELRP